MFDSENQNLFSTCISQKRLWGSACLMVYVNCCWFLGFIVLISMISKMKSAFFFNILAMCFRWLNNKIQHEGVGENGVPILFRLQCIWLKPTFIGLYQYDLVVADFKTMAWILPSFLLLASTSILECLSWDSFLLYFPLIYWNSIFLCTTFIWFNKDFSVYQQQKENRYFKDGLP